MSKQPPAHGAILYQRRIRSNGDRKRSGVNPDALRRHGCNRRRELLAQSRLQSLFWCGCLRRHSLRIARRCWRALGGLAGGVKVTVWVRLIVAWCGGSRANFTRSLSLWWLSCRFAALLSWNRMRTAPGCLTLMCMGLMPGLAGRLRAADAAPFGCGLRPGGVVTVSGPVAGTDT